MGDNDKPPIIPGSDVPGAGGDGKPVVKTVEQRMADMDESNKKLLASNQSYQEEVKRMTQMTDALMRKLNTPSGNAPGIPVGQTVPVGTVDRSGVVKVNRDFSQFDPAVDPAGFAQNIISETVEQVSQNYATMRQNETYITQMKAQFYKTSPDLMGHEITVQHFSQEVAADSAHLPLHLAFEETAKRTRNYLKDKGITTTVPTVPPHVLPPNLGGKDGNLNVKVSTKDSNPGVFDEAKMHHDALQDEIKQRSNNMEQGVLPGGIKQPTK